MAKGAIRNGPLRFLSTPRGINSTSTFDDGIVFRKNTVNANLGFRIYVANTNKAADQTNNSFAFDGIRLFWELRAVNIAEYTAFEPSGTAKFVCLRDDSDTQINVNDNIALTISFFVVA